MYNICIPTHEENTALEVARIGFMAAAPFYSHLFFSEMKEVLTYDIPTAATDGRHVFINPKYLAGMKPPEAVFIYAHEVAHFVYRHCQRMKSYETDGSVEGTPYDKEQFNQAADYVINADLVEQGVGLINPSWLFADDVTGEDLVEGVYARKYQKKPPGPSTYGSSGKAPKGAKGDPTAQANNGQFDELLPPPVDPVTGKVDAPDDAEFKEAIARAFTAAKAMGTVHDNIKRQVEEILAPQVDWKEHIRLLLTGHMGSRHETWNTPNRRRLVLNPLVMMPGKRGYGADTVAIGVDTSGSIGDKELSAFFGEVAAVLADIRPKKVMLVFCDAKVHRVDEANSLDELAEIRAKGAPGGGGTSFIPVFDYLAENEVKPDTLVYITDGFGSAPNEAPGYPVVWCVTEGGREQSFGDHVWIEV